MDNIEVKNSQYYHLDNGGLTFTITRHYEPDRKMQIVDAVVEVEISRYESRSSFSFNLPIVNKPDEIVRQLSMIRDVITETLNSVLYYNNVPSSLLKGWLANAQES